jgi:hypothetical protein
MIKPASGQGISNDGYTAPGGGRSYAFVFICQKGEWELKALLLAASLGRFLKCDHELVAALPAPAETWGMPCEATLSLLARLGARIVPVVNEVNPLFTHANKIACLKISTTADKIVFLDSDMLCLREFRDEPRFAEEINVKPADLQTFASGEELWNLAYGAAGVPVPPVRIAATFSGEPGPPYFNSGFIALKNGIPLADAWVACARAMNRVDAIPKKDPWSDQPSLAIAMHKLKLRYDILDERYNFPAHLRKLDGNDPPWFCHYHYPSIIKREAFLAKLVRDLAGAHPEIAELMRHHEAWAALA